jgi:hypothetical protein
MTLHKSQRKDLQKNFLGSQGARHFAVTNPGLAVVLAFRIGMAGGYLWGLVPLPDRLAEECFDSLP